MANERSEPKDDRCRHPSCNCPAERAEGYCSLYCAGADHTDTETGACACGHEACLEAQQGGSPHSHDEVKTSIGSR